MFAGGPFVDPRSLSPKILRPIQTKSRARFELGKSRLNLDDDPLTP